MRGKFHGLKFEYSKPEESSNRLAIQLAEALHGVMEHQKDHDAFVVASRAERTKAQQLQVVIFELIERQRGKPFKQRRMDPYAEYDLDTCQTEYELFKTRSVELQDKANEAANAVQLGNQIAQKLQRKIRLAISTK